MKKIFAIVFFISAMCSFAFAQTNFPEFEKAKKIKLLESTQIGVRQVFSDYKTGDENAEKFSTANAFIEVNYTQESCSEEDSVESVKWNVSSGKVLYITIKPRKTIKIKDLDINPSNYRKEQKYANIEDEFVYHNKNFGFAFEVAEEEIEKILIFPSRSYQSFLCDDEDSKKLFLSESWFYKPNLEDRIYNPPGNAPPAVSALDLSADEIIIGCNEQAKGKSCSGSNSRISVITTSPLDDGIFTYEYAVSAGKIVGKDRKVIWDLSGVKPGTYTITAGVNDGCGICGATITKTVVIKECPDCSIKDN